MFHDKLIIHLCAKIRPLETTFGEIIFHSQNLFFIELIFIIFIQLIQIVFNPSFSQIHDFKPLPLIFDVSLLTTEGCFEHNKCVIVFINLTWQTILQSNFPVTHTIFSSLNVFELFLDIIVNLNVV